MIINCLHKFLFRITTFFSSADNPIHILGILIVIVKLEFNFNQIKETMKSKIIYILVGLLFVGIGAKAQEGMPKIGYTNTDYILSLMPATKTIQKELADYNDLLAKQLKAKEQTFQQKLQEYEKTVASMTDLVKKDKERELQSLDSSLRQFQQEAQSSFTQKQKDLLSPVLEEIRLAIQNVAKENNFTHILNSSASGLDVLLFAKEEYDVSNLVLAKLGVTPPATSN